MLYRVVIQGRTLAGADVDEVKRQFVRVTGLPPSVAAQYFGGMPQVVKRQVLRKDAERIAATLRAIGAVATVEREGSGTDDDGAGGEVVITTPLNNGPPTIVPGAVALPEVSPAVERRMQLRRAMRSKWTLGAGVAILVAGAILLAPYFEELTGATGSAPASAPAPARVAPTEVVAPAVEPPQEAPAIQANLLQGPWRCTNQSTGVSVYWSYVADGALILHGDVLSEKSPPREVAESAPTRWTIVGQQLSHIYPQRSPDTYAIAQLSLSRLHYGDERGLEVECRRP